MRHKLALIAIITSLVLILNQPAEIKTADAQVTRVREEQILINPQHYSVPPKMSDAQIAIETFENLMLRYMDQTEYNYHMLSAEIGQVMAKLEQLEAKIDKLADEKSSGGPQNQSNDPNNL